MQLRQTLKPMVWKVRDTCRILAGAYKSLRCSWQTHATVPETISRSRDMVGAHENLNGSRDLTTPFSSTIHTCCHQPTYQLTKFEVSNSTC